MSARNLHPGGYATMRPMRSSSAAGPSASTISTSSIFGGSGAPAITASGTQSVRGSIGGGGLPSTPSAMDSLHTSQTVQDLNYAIAKGLQQYNQKYEKKGPASSSATSVDQYKLQTMANRFFYRIGYIVNCRPPFDAKLTDLSKEILLTLSVQLEVRQMIMDIYEQGKRENEKGQKILNNHAWLFGIALSIEDIFLRLTARQTSTLGLNSNLEMGMPRLIEAPLELFEERMAYFQMPTIDKLYAECGDIKNMRGQAETLLSHGVDSSIILLTLGEIVGKVFTVLILKSDVRRDFHSLLISVFSVCRANSWSSLRYHHGLDILKTSTTMARSDKSQQKSRAYSAAIPEPGASPMRPAAQPASSADPIAITNSHTQGVHTNGNHHASAVSSSALVSPPGSSASSPATSSSSISAPLNVPSRPAPPPPSALTTLLPSSTEIIRSMSEGSLFTGYFLGDDTQELTTPQLIVFYDSSIETKKSDAASPTKLSMSPATKARSIASPGAKGKRLSVIDPSSGSALKSAPAAATPAPAPEKLSKNPRTGALYWCPVPGKTKTAECCLPLKDVSDILLGCQTPALQASTSADPAACFTIISKQGYSINLEAPSATALSMWLTNFTKLLNASGKKMMETTDDGSGSASANSTSVFSAASDDHLKKSPPLPSRSTRPSAALMQKRAAASQTMKLPRAPAAHGIVQSSMFDAPSATETDDVIASPPPVKATSMRTPPPLPAIPVAGGGPSASPTPTGIPDPMNLYASPNTQHRRVNSQSIAKESGKNLFGEEAQTPHAALSAVSSHPLFMFSAAKASGGAERDSVMGHPRTSSTTSPPTNHGSADTSKPYKMLLSPPAGNYSQTATTFSYGEPPSPRSDALSAAVPVSMPVTPRRSSLTGGTGDQRDAMAAALGYAPLTLPSVGTSSPASPPPLPASYVVPPPARPTVSEPHGGWTKEKNDDGFTIYVHTVKQLMQFDKPDEWDYEYLPPPSGAAAPQSPKVGSRCAFAGCEFPKMKGKPYCRGHSQGQ